MHTYWAYHYEKDWAFASEILEFVRPFFSSHEYKMCKKMKCGSTDRIEVIKNGDNKPFLIIK